MTPGPSPLPSGTSWDRSVARGCVRFADYSRWGLPDRPLHAALAQEGALWGYQPRRGGGETQRRGSGTSSRAWAWRGYKICGQVATPHSPSLALLQVDPMLTLEEQQLRELQRHGYENPTYRFLEE